MRFAQQFTRNKDAVRTLQREAIEEHFISDRGRLRYFGLTSSALGDVRQWNDLFEVFYAVERGEQGKEWELQHELELEAFRCGLFNKIQLLRGDIDQVIKDKQDIHGNPAPFPFHVISLDYSGGLFYREPSGKLGRLEAIAKAIAHQAAKHQHFLLLLSSNLDQVDQGEVRRTLENVRTELVRYGVAGEQVVDKYLSHPRDEARLKIYVPYFINQEAAKNRYSCETSPVIIYEGNLNVPMMAFRTYLRFDSRTQALRSPKERLSQLFNKPLLQIKDGGIHATMMDLPKIASGAETPNAEKS
jgi:hypothetical protein